MPRRGEPLFLERQNYRRRRMMDLARLLPVLGLFAFMLPLLGGPEGISRTAGNLVYFFLSWFGLIVMAWALARRLSHEGLDGEQGETGEDGDAR
ncbi:MAG: hypothetical protein ACP5DX_17295 [Paracoccaceae bacterium]